MKALISWFVATPFLYYSLALSCLLGFGLFATIHSEGVPRNWKSDWLFLVLAGCTVMVWRWPTMLWPQPMNIDEGQWAAGALKATYDFAPWRGFDGTTSGPLNAYVLALPALFGAPITFFSTRLIAFGLIIGSIYALYFIVKWTHGTRIARLSIVPPVAFLGLTWEWDFLPYSSETLPVFLTTIGTASAAYLATGDRPKRARLAACALGGLFLGSAGFAKLQALPIALTSLALIAGIILLKREGSRRDKWMEALTTAVGFSLVPAILTLSVISTGVWNDAYISYYKYAFVHVTSGITVGFNYFFGFTITYSTFAIASLLVIAVGTIALAGRWRFTKRSAVIAACALCFLLVCLIVIVVPRHAYPHYLLFSVFPLSYCVATVLQFTCETNLWKGRDRMFSSVIVAGFLVPALALSMDYSSPYVGGRREVFLHGRPDLAAYLPFQRTDAQVQAIRRYAIPGTRVAIWGWMPHYYVQTQTIPATRDAHTLLQELPGPYREYFRARFLSDLRQSRPSVFIDAAAPGSFGINYRATQGFETFGALAAFINDNYLLKEDVEGVRIFALKNDKTPSIGPATKQ